MRLRFGVMFGFCILAGCSRSGETEKTNQGTPPVITQFYASVPAIAKGEAGVLCYGVEGAESMRLEPAVEKLTPAVSKCFEVKPTETTTYTLIAQNKAGEEAKRTAILTVGGARPKLRDMEISAVEVSAGETVKLCWKASGATKVEAGPGKLSHGGRASDDCVEDRPRSTTRYTVTVSNEAGLQDTDSVVVRVK